MCLNMMVPVRAPTARDAYTYWFSFTAMTAPLMTLDPATPYSAPSTIITCTSPGPTTAMMVRIKKSAGMHIHPSTNLWMKVSTLPPRKPEIVPIVVAMRMQRLDTPRLTYMEIRAP